MEGTMVTILSLWLPILLSAVFVFVASSFIHMVLPYHRKDFGPVPKEDEIMESLRAFSIPPGDYVIPYAGSSKVMNSPEYKEKVTKGPGVFMTVVKSGPSSMVGSLVLWFLYSIIIGIFAAYIASRALAPGAEYLTVFRFTGCTAFIGYSLALLQNSIWYKRKWSSTLKSMFDGFIYALLTAGVFSWLWPA
jgi:hypothetical protein